MTIRKSYLATALTAAALLSGCGASGGPVAEKSAPPTPHDALLAAVPDDADGAYKFTIKGGETPLSGVVDAAGKAMLVKAEESDTDLDLKLTMTTLVVDDVAWMKITFKPADLPGLPRLPKKWLKLDDAKLGDANAIKGEYADPGSAGPIVANAKDVTVAGPGKYAGTTDLSGSRDAEIVSPDVLDALGAKAKAVPFTAVVDDAGHLTTLTLKIPAAGKAKAATYAIAYSGYGATETPAVPSKAEQTPAPAVVYEMVNG